MHGCWDGDEFRRNNEIGSTGAASLADGLRYLQALTSLDLRHERPEGGSLKQTQHDSIPFASFHKDLA